MKFLNKLKKGISALALLAFLFTNTQKIKAEEKIDFDYKETTQNTQLLKVWTDSEIEELCSPSTRADKFFYSGLGLVLGGVFGYLTYDAIKESIEKNKGCEIIALTGPASLFFLYHSFSFGKEAITGEEQKKKMIAYNEWKKERNKQIELENKLAAEMREKERLKVEDYEQKKECYEKIDKIIDEMNKIKDFDIRSFYKNEAEKIINEIIFLKNNGLSFKKEEFCKKVDKFDKLAKNLENNLWVEVNKINENEITLDNLINNLVCVDNYEEIKNKLEEAFECGKSTGDFTEFKKQIKIANLKLEKLNNEAKQKQVLIDNAKSYLKQRKDKLTEEEFSKYESMIDTLNPKCDGLDHILESIKDIKKEIKKSIKFNTFEAYLPSSLYSFKGDIKRRRMVEFNDGAIAIELQLDFYDDFGSYVKTEYERCLIEFDNSKENWILIKRERSKTPMETREDRAIKKLFDVYEKIKRELKDIKELVE